MIACLVSGLVAAIVNSVTFRSTIVTNTQRCYLNDAECFLGAPLDFERLGL